MKSPIQAKIIRCPVTSPLATLLLLCLYGCTHQSVSARPHTSATQAHRWEPSTAALYTPTESPRSLSCWRTTCRVTDTGKRTWEEPAIVFTDPASGSVWAGREWPYYVKTNNRILGLWPDDAGMLQWYGSSITKLDRDEDVVKRFEEATNSTSDLADPPFVGETNLRDLLNINFFNATPGSMNSAAGNINQIGFDRGLLKLDLDSPTRAFHAQIWIDVDTREVVRAIEDGKVVFPKQ